VSCWWVVVSTLATETKRACPCEPLFEEGWLAGRGPGTGRRKMMAALPGRPSVSQYDRSQLGSVGQILPSGEWIVRVEMIHRRGGGDPPVTV
jgi:hypothetical protein